MKKIALADTSCGTMNAGVDVIMKYTREELKDIINGNIVCSFPTHTPLCHSYQVKSSEFTKWISSADYKFISGTNLLKMNMLCKNPLWNINIFNCMPLQNSVLVGVGRAGNPQKINWYTRYIYKKVLSKKFIHSVRDEETKKILEKMGFKAINTGCITLWGLTNEFCKTIKKEKSDDVVTSLNCKSKNKTIDSQFISMLKRNYNKVYFWPQTIGDIDYLKTLDDVSDLIIIPNNLDSFGELLDNNNIDYVGARLHGGIFCMHHKIRTIILSVDYRSTDMQKTFNINSINRDEIDLIESKINSSFETKINLDYNKINEWKKQFK